MARSYAEQQHTRDLRERLNSRRQEGKTRHSSLRSRSRSSENPNREARSPRSPPYGRRGRRVRRNSRSSWPSESTDGSPPAPSGRSSKTPREKETNPVILARRQKQLDYGRNTLCYQEYTKAVPKHKREPFHPRTPVKTRQTSRRRWDSAIKNWRIHLHYWNDPVKLAELRRRKDSDSDASESESAGTASVASTPERGRANTRRPARETATTSGVKSEPSEPSISTVKQEPRESAAAAARQTSRGTGPAAIKQEPASPVVVKQEPASPVSVKQEPADPDLTEIKRERLDPEPVAVQREPPEQQPVPMQSEVPRVVKQEPMEPEDEFVYDHSLSWADDVEGLAEELAGEPIV